ncbi:MAG TPA: maleylpyruvate isomerase family mycothiol-dependent enzyme [Chloroflexota bacterium]|nr:maleylpyruvate isomerase family mycothiol-dependent enzyme [Chloroflexota bacterium]
MAASLDSVRSAEHREFDRLSAYLEKLDPDGWQEISYCADWPVLRVASHMSSNAVITRGRFATWFKGEAALGREDFMKIWGHFDSLTAQQMVPEFKKAHGDYLALLDTLTDEQANTEVEAFAGKAPAMRYVLARLSETTLHAWDIYVGRDRTAKLPEGAVEALLPIQRAATLDKTRIEKLKPRVIQFRTTNPASSYVLDLSGDAPVLSQGENSAAELSLEMPAEQFCRLMYGRDYVPGVKSGVKVLGGSADDQGALFRAFR